MLWTISIYFSICYILYYYHKKEEDVMAICREGVSFKGLRRNAGIILLCLSIFR